MRPAIRPASSEARPRVAEIVWASEVSNDSGSEPYLSTLERSVADCWLKLPLIWEVPPGWAASIVGADTTWESRSKATPLPMSAVVYCSQIPAPADLKVTLMTYPARCWLGAATASATSGPERIEGPRTYLAVAL